MQNPWGHQQLHQVAELAPSKSSLFQQFTPRGFQGRFAWFKRSSRQLDHLLLHGYSVVANQADSSILQNGDDDDGTGMFDDLSPGQLSVGQQVTNSIHAKSRRL
jgi:hypothetical protein